jgi:DNA-directed RNA polymerase subunit M/transcription elongation factor TFIIS
MISDKIRDEIFNKFNKLFGPSISKEIERSVYEYSKDYAENNNTLFLLESIYKSKADELFSIISGDNLQNTIKAINNNIIKPINIAQLKPSELNIILSNKMYLDILKKKEYNMDIKKGTKLFKCSKCKKRNSIIMEKQVFRADEPATQFITCLECGNVTMTER